MPEEKKKLYIMCSEPGCYGQMYEKGLCNKHYTRDLKKRKRAKDKKPELLHLLRRAREARQLNLRELAKKVGVSQSTIAAYEKGEHAPRYEVWIKLKKILNLPGEPGDYWEYFKGKYSGKYGPTGEKICKERGCYEKVLARGLCSKHYQRKLRRLAQEKQ